jgi:hypothetical protein
MAEIPESRRLEAIHLNGRNDRKNVFALGLYELVLIPINFLLPYFLVAGAPPALRRVHSSRS